jgi:hypothetical protein
MGAGLAAWPNGEPKYPQRDFQSPPLDSLALALTRVPAGLLHRRRRWGCQRTGSAKFPIPERIAPPPQPAARSVAIAQLAFPAP